MKDVKGMKNLIISAANVTAAIMTASCKYFIKDLKTNVFSAAQALVRRGGKEKKT